MDSFLSPELDSDLDQLDAQVKSFAEGKNLVVVPAMPLRDGNSRLLVLLGKEDMTASEFCDLAVAAGSKLLYVDAEPFDAEVDLDPTLVSSSRFRDLEEVNAALEVLRETAKAYNGHIGQLELGFAAEGILHCWLVTSKWQDDLTARIEEMLLQDAERGPGRISDAEARAVIDRLAQELVDMPEFRSAATPAQRHRVAFTQHAEIAAMDAEPGHRSGFLASEAISKAEMHISADADRKYGEIERHLTELAAEFEATPAYRNAGSARARREHARDFLAEKSGGYAPPARVLELLLDTPPLQRPGPMRS